MDDQLQPARQGDVIEVEPCFELTDAAAAYLASHSLTDAPADAHV